ncbi:MAG: biotin/lipoyl-binding protein [Rhodospirillaceae bacterium]|nr:biotin/lipoyl-binding protein [Rhodospirillaceae bacterium]MBT5244284.1 biotin/lipoyl-binding protein [Rhodospirillaceae bacterium]MBT5563645.1 biotin/lipoyl-binding protein [Rhodospirillaceae bacterium]MBT6241475.1 biotin/lipoyl-binding protein [Rhodospirillaceae bacterium]MBT7138822.1 biotin/lipoyl-binding protein [Rhodospirillaceae bacterium]
MFSSILIANRGEIAVRIAGTARAMGVRTVAVFSEHDVDALHVDVADQAYQVDDYLGAQAIIEIALKSGAQAVHPGYGFLSENAAFAAAVEDAGLTFIGPPVSAIDAMGSKVRARRIMEAADVPVVPGYHGAKQDLKTLTAAAKKIGYPVMIKASAGGGGRGMRVVEKAADLEASIASARREAKAAFGDTTLLLEKCVVGPRHVEVQVFADNFGNSVSLSERDCSIQRRHQKVLEEAPAPGLSQALRQDLSNAALAAADAIGYVGAGTVEFLLSPDGAFYFMEMNTRLQVEHPVTEMIFGEDLVEWQLLVAAGFELPRDQMELMPSGHALEARLYAEDPSNDFLPTGGVIERFRLGSSDEYGGMVRVDSAVREGDAVSSHYDPMIAKVVVWGIDREVALSRMSMVLEDMEVAGVVTNLQFLRRAFAHSAFRKARIDTGFIERHRRQLCAQVKNPGCDALALASLSIMLRRDAQAARLASTSKDPYSPWHSTLGWRMNGDNHHVLNFHTSANKKTTTVCVHYRADGFFLEIAGTTLSASGHFDDEGSVIASIDGRRVKAMVCHLDREIVVDVLGQIETLVLDDPAASLEGHEHTGGSLAAPMPGRVVQVSVKAGDQVKTGDPLIVLEAMKMEHTISAPASGTVGEVFFAVDDRVEEGALLLSLD